MDGMNAMDLLVKASYAQEKTEIIPVPQTSRAITALSMTYTQKQFPAINANTAEQEHSDYNCLL